MPIKQHLEPDMDTMSLLYFHSSLLTPQKKFMCLMRNILKKFMERFILVFIDYIIIYSRNEEECKENLKLVLKTSRKNHLYVKYNKCEFYKTKIQYPCHISFKEGLAVDPKKVKDTEKWPIPKYVSIFQSFMGLAWYYHQFIEAFPKISHPIISLQSKGFKYECTTECQRSFDQLKQLLTMTPILKLADPNEDFTMCTNARIEGLGGFRRSDCAR